MLQNFPCRLQFYLQLNLAFLSLYNGKKSLKDFLVNNETEIHQIF